MTIACAVQCFITWIFLCLSVQFRGNETKFCVCLNYLFTEATGLKVIIGQVLVDKMTIQSDISQRGKIKRFRDSKGALNALCQIFNSWPFPESCKCQKCPSYWSLTRYLKPSSLFAIRDQLDVSFFFRHTVCSYWQIFYYKSDIDSKRSYHPRSPLSPAPAALPVSANILLWLLWNILLQ